MKRKQLPILVALLVVGAAFMIYRLRLNSDSGLFQYGWLAFECDNDVSLVALNLQTEPGEDSKPFLRMKYWGDSKPEKKAGSYVIEGDAVTLAKGQGDYCPVAGNCEPVEKFQATISLSADLSGGATFHFKRFNQPMVEGQAKVRWTEREVPTCLSE